MGLALSMSSLGRDQALSAASAGADAAHDDRRGTPAQPVPPARILDYVDLRERGAQLRRMRDLTAQTAADAVVVDVRHRIAAQRIRIGLNGQRRTAREPDARVVTGAYLGIDPVARAHHALAGGAAARQFGPNTTLPRQLTFTVGDDDLQAVLAAAHRLAQAVGHRPDAIAAHALDPAHADTSQRRLDVKTPAAALYIRRAGQNILLAGGAGVTVVDQHQNRVIAVENRAGNAGQQAVVPKAAIAHDADRTLRLGARYRGGRGQ